MYLAGILLLVTASLSLPAIIRKHSQKNGWRSFLLFFRAGAALLIFLWSCYYIILTGIVYGPEIIQRLGIMFFLTLLFSYVILLGLNFSTAFDMGQILCKGNSKALPYTRHEERLTGFVDIQIPLAALCLLIGIWDLLYIPFLHAYPVL